MIPNVFIRTINQESRALDCRFQHVVLSEERKLVYCNEVCALDEIGTPDRTRTKTEVRYSHRARFLGVVNKITLRVVWSFFADDLDGVFVGAHGSVRAEAPENRAHLVVRFGAERWVKRNTRERDVVFDTD